MRSWRCVGRHDGQRRVHGAGVRRAGGYMSERGKATVSIMQNGGGDETMALGWGWEARRGGDGHSQSVSIVLGVHWELCVHELVLLVFHGGGVVVGGEEQDKDDEGRKEGGAREG